MRFRPLLSRSLLGLGLMAVIVSSASAQGRSYANQGRSGGFGQSAIGQSAFGQGGRSGFGATGGMGRGGAGYGTNAFGAGRGTNFGAIGGTRAFGNNQLGIAGQGNFLGGDAAQTQNFFRNLNRGQRRNTSADFMIENLNEMRNRGNSGSANSNLPPVRVKLRPAFDAPAVTIQQASVKLQSRLTTSVSDLGVVDSRVLLDDRTIVLEGKVPTEHQRALVEKVVSLEPGVSRIDNRLVVDSQLLEE